MEDGIKYDHTIKTWRERVDVADDISFSSSSKHVKVKYTCEYHYSIKFIFKDYSGRDMFIVIDNDFDSIFLDGKQIFGYDGDKWINKIGLYNE